MQADAKERIAGGGIKYLGYGVPLYLTIIYLMFEYGRPQMAIPWIQPLRLPGIAIGLLGLMLIGSRRIRLRETQTRLFIALLVLMAIHIPFAVNNYWAYQTTLAMLITFIGYLAIVVFVDSFRKYQIVMSAWICIHIFLAVYGFLKGGRGIGGFLGDENDFALALNMVIPFSFFLAMEAKSKLKRLLYLIITAVFVMGVVVTFSRGGFIGLIAVGVYCWVKSPRKIFSICMVVLLICTTIYFSPDKYWEEIESIREEAQGSKRGTGQERTYSWEAGWRMFLDHPILGVGPGNFNWNFQSYEPAEGLYGRTHGGRSAHSLYFTLLPELGVAGTIVFLSMLMAIWRDRREILKFKKVGKGAVSRIAWNGENGSRISGGELSKIYYLALAMGGSLIGYLVSGAFLSVLYYPNFWILLGFSLSLRNLFRNKREDLGVGTIAPGAGTGRAGRWHIRDDVNH